MFSDINYQFFFVLQEPECDVAHEREEQLQLFSYRPGVDLWKKKFQPGFNNIFKLAVS